MIGRTETRQLLYLATVVVLAASASTVALVWIGTTPSGGADTARPTAWTQGAAHTIRFVEHGLLPGTSWCVTVTSQRCATGTTLAFKGLPASAYSYAIAPVPGYTAGVKVGPAAGTASGTANLTVHDLTFQVRFSPMRYALTFAQQGLKSGIAWHLSVTCTVPKAEHRGCDGMKASGTTKGAEFGLMLRNGTYTWAVTSVPHYELWVDGINCWGGTITVNGAGGTLSAVFMPIAPRLA